MPNVLMRYALGLITLRQQTARPIAGSVAGEIVLSAGKVISQQMIDEVVTAVPHFEIDVAPVLTLEEIIERNRRRVDGALAADHDLQSPPPQAVTLVASYEPGVVIFEQGDASDEIYVLQDGAVEILVNGVRVNLIREPGSYLGEMSVLTGERRSATVRTVEDSTFKVIPGPRLELAIRQNPSMGFQLTSLIVDRLKRSDQVTVRLSERLSRLESRLKVLAAALNIHLEKQSKSFFASRGAAAPAEEMKSILDDKGLVDLNKLLE